MAFEERRPGGRLFASLAIGMSAALIAACSSTQPKVAVAKKSKSKEYFAESEYGVKASPRVSNLRSNLPRGGGREQIGRPYQIRGQWFHPKEEPGYRNSGMASWYGDAFHGRLTANGEVYDMTHLTAAHPTMPLPSYARVTNKQNGSSVVVRVNDRGPFARGRIIDLSKRAAELLDYTNSGVARVEVEYMGRAPLHGRDDEFLMASYRPAGRAPDPGDGLPSGVMIAMNGPTPSQALAMPVAAASAFPGRMTSAPAPGQPGLSLPDSGPLLPERPTVMPVFTTASAGTVATLSYADERISAAAGALAALSAGASGIAAADGGEYVAVGTYASEEEARAHAGRLGAVGRAAVAAGQDGEGTWYAVTLHGDGRASLDELLRAAWSAGAGEAIPVRD